MTNPTSNSSTAPSPVAAPPPASLPAPEDLTAVMDRLADPAVSGDDKLVLIEDATPRDVATIDRFATALRDGGFTPATFTATDVHWSEATPGVVLATLRITNPDDHNEFAFPLAFRPGPTGWQLTRDTAEMLLAFQSGQ